MTNFRALQVANTNASKKMNKPQPRPLELKARYLAMASWHADLSRDGQYHLRGSGSGKPSGRAKKRLLAPPPGGWKGGAA